ncbi:MAG: energy transducer TonB, partial [Chitinophagaceae bacterium]
LLAIGAFLLSNYLAKQAALHPKPIVADVHIQNVDLKQNNMPPPPPPPPAPQPPKVKPQIQYTPPQVVKDNQVKPNEQPPDLNQIKNQAISTVTKAGDVNGIDPGLVAERGVVAGAGPSETKVFKFVEQMPSFPGGDGALMKYLTDHIHYPAMARENGIQGTVVVQFIVGPDGTIRDVTTVSKTLGGGLEQEAMRVVKEMPKWIPGKQNGRAVNVQYSLPVRFMLQ